MWPREIRERQAHLAKQVGLLEKEVAALRRRLRFEPRVVCDIGTVDVDDRSVKVSASPEQLESWRPRQYRDIKRGLADLGADTWLTVNGMGQADLAPNLSDVDEDDVDRWATELFAEAIPRDHPCWRGTLGRGTPAPMTYASTAPHVTWQYGSERYDRERGGEPVYCVDPSDERLGYGHFACCIDNPDSPIAYFFQQCVTRRITSFRRDDFWMLTRVAPSGCMCSSKSEEGKSPSTAM